MQGEGYAKPWLCEKMGEAKEYFSSSNWSKSREQGSKMSIANLRREDDQNMEKVSEWKWKKCLCGFTE